MYCAQHVTQAPPSPTTQPGSLYTVQYMCAQLELGGGGGGYKTMNFYENN